MSRIYTSIFLFISIISSTYADGFISKTFTFIPNEPQNVDNPLWWALDTKCHIESQDAENRLFAKMVRKNGKLNGSPLSEGEELWVTVQNDSTLHIEADYNARVQITNQGPSIVVAKCSI